MGLHKGQSNNLNGRPKGSQNKDLQENRKFIKEFVEQYCNSGQFAKTFDKLEIRDKMRVMLDLMQYVTPKLQSVSNDITFPEKLPPIIIQPAPDYIPVKDDE